MTEQFKTNTDENYFLKAEGLTMHFPAASDALGRPTSWIHAADDVSFAVPKGKTLGVVGESGCGKSTVGKMLLDIYRPTSGKIFYEGKDITALSPKERRPYVKKMQLVWQDPYSSLDPRLRAGDIIAEPIDNFRLAANRAERAEKVERLMQMCGLYPEMATHYPHQFSGGQRQRICIARALATDPEFVVCDEAVSALDVSIQAQVLNLLMQLKEERHLTYIFITHNLSVVEYISDRIAVMYLGRIVELSSTEQIFDHTMHPYTEALLSAIPVVDPDNKRSRIVLEGDVPNPVHPPEGCHFHPRCKKCMEICKHQKPVLKRHIIDGEEHFCACHLYDDTSAAAPAKKE